MTRKQRVRQQFRQAVFERDGYRCVGCKRPGYDRQTGEWAEVRHLVPLDAHHLVDRSDPGHDPYDVGSAVTLCDDCHKLAEGGTTTLQTG